MHKHGICHRDLKPENILLKAGTVKICDLGTAKKLDMNFTRMNTPYVVSRYYRAPELVLGSQWYDHTVDVWAAACILFELFTLTPLFPGDSEGMQLYEQACVLGAPTLSEIAFLLKSCEKHPCEKVLNSIRKHVKFPKQDFADLLKLVPCQYSDDDIKDAADLLQKCLKWCQQDRLQAEKALEHKFLS